MQIRTPWAAYCLDSAAAYFGTVVENAAQEMVNVGTDAAPKWEARYSLGELLTPGFRIGADEGDDVDSLLGMQGVVFDEVRA